MSTQQLDASGRKLARTIMVLGTASDVGKSIVTTGLCRVLADAGWRVVPFKSQNMSNNSYVTPDGKEIGRAQGVQADACRVAATTDMNPILLKPSGEMTSQVVVHGVPLAEMHAKAYRESYLETAASIVQDALLRLREQADVVVLEGAGSPAEINLKDRDIVNMRAAEWADSQAILVADIDRGGVFASIVGTLELLTPAERERICGFVINKFRGDVSLLKPGLDWLEARTGKPVLGVLPHLPMLDIEDEDSLSLDSKRSASSAMPPKKAELDIAVIRFPRISNFTDIDPLELEPDVAIRYVTGPSDWGNPDAIILPGSKNTLLDMQFLAQAGLQAMIRSFASEQNGFIAGICGGYQMLGRKLYDPLGVESSERECEGLSLVPAETVFESVKRTVCVAGNSYLFGEKPQSIEGYEIHMGRTRLDDGVEQPFRIKEAGCSAEGEASEGAVSVNGRIWGTYVHGILHNDAFRRSWLNAIRTAKGLPLLNEQFNYKERREKAFDRLAEHVRCHLDMNRIYEMIGLRSSPTVGGDER